MDIVPSRTFRGSRTSRQYIQLESPELDKLLSDSPPLIEVGVARRLVLGWSICWGLFCFCSLRYGCLRYTPSSPGSRAKSTTHARRPVREAWMDRPSPAGAPPRGLGQSRWTCGSESPMYVYPRSPTGYSYAKILDVLARRGFGQQHRPSRPHSEPTRSKVCATGSATGKCSPHRDSRKSESVYRCCPTRNHLSEEFGCAPGCVRLLVLRPG